MSLTSQAASGYERSAKRRMKIRAEYTPAAINPLRAERISPRVLCHAVSITLTAAAVPQSKSMPH